MGKLIFKSGHKIKMKLGTDIIKLIGQKINNASKKICRLPRADKIIVI